MALIEDFNFGCFLVIFCCVVVCLFFLVNRRFCFRLWFWVLRSHCLSVWLVRKCGGNDSEKIEIQVNFSFENLELSMLVIEVLWIVYVYRIWFVDWLLIFEFCNFFKSKSWSFVVVVGSDSLIGWGGSGCGK